MSWSPSALACAFLAAAVVSACAAPPSRGLTDERALFGPRERKTSGLGVGDIRFAASEHVLPSGLRVALERTRTNGVAGVVVTIGSGGAHDPANKEGLAHYVEHLAFRARHGEVRSLEDRFRLIGATGVNAETSPDSTRYYAYVPAQKLPELLRLYGLLLARTLDGVEQDEAVTEREVVENELRQRDETGVGGQLRGWLHEALMPAAHPYRRPVGGTIESVDALTLADAAAFVEAHYRPYNVSISVAGELDRESLDTMVNAQLPAAFRGEADKPVPPASSSVPPLDPAPPPEPPSGAYTHYAAVQKPTVVIAWRLPSVYEQGGHNTRILTAPAALRALEQYAGGQDGVDDADAWVSHYQRTSIVACAAALDDPTKWLEVARKVRGFFAEWWTPIDQQALGAYASQAGWQSARVVWAEDQRALYAMRQQTAAAYLYSAESWVGRLHELAAFFHESGNAEAFGQHVAWVRKTTYKEIATLAPLFLSPAQARVIYLHSVPPDQRAALGRVGVKRDEMLSTVADEPGDAAVLGTPPRAREEEAFGAMRERVLPNGLTLVLLKRAWYPTVTAALGYRVGWASSSPRGAHDLLRLVEHFLPIARQEHGLSLEPLDGPDFSADVVRAGRSNLPQALALLASRAIETDRKVEWSRVTAALRALPPAQPKPDDPDERIEHGLRTALYGRSGLERKPTFQELRFLAPSAVERWLRRSRHPKNAVLVVAGDLDLDVAEQWVGRVFGGWLGSDEGAAQPPVVAPAPAPGAAQERVLVEHRSTSPQVDVTIACRLPDADERADAVYDVLGSVVGGWLSTRLRHEAGLSYGVHGGPAIHRGGASHLSLSLSVDKRQLVHALRIVRGHWRRFGEGAFDAGAISQARWSLLTGSNLGYLSSMSLALGVLSSTTKGWHPDHVARWRSDLATVSPADLERAFRVCRASTVLALVGDRTVIDAAVAKR